MCQFCHQHGEGKKWYLRAENYSEELISDMRRRRFIADFIKKTAQGSFELEKELLRAGQAPSVLKNLGFSVIEKRQRRDHYGQVVPIEDVEKVLALANSIVRVPCVCRKKTTGRTDNSFCFGLGIDAEKLLDIKEAFLESFRPGPEEHLFERLTAAEALDLHRSFEGKGLIHTLWTFKTPFIGGLCNCDRSDCLAMTAYRHGLQLFFRGEYVAEIDLQSCAGCRSCLDVCLFGAIGFPDSNKKASIDPQLCQGCGVCRSACEFEAITLNPRNSHPLASNLW
jgi:ferredoxin